MIDGADTALTFEPHPLRVLHPEAAPKLIMPFEIKRDVIEGLGVEELVVIPFDDEFSAIAAEDFCSRILVEALGAERVSVGENFRFGAKAKGDPRDARRTRGVRDPRRAVGGGGRRDRFLDPDPLAGRRRRGRGRDPLPGRAFLLEGTVVEGDGRGRKLGFATANIVPADDLVCPGTASMRRSPTAGRRPSTSASGRPSRPDAGCSWRRT